MAEQIPEADLQPQPVLVIPGTESRLAQLHAAYPDAKAKADEAADQLKAITDGIKSELQAQGGNAKRLELRSPHGPALSLAYVSSWRLDSKKLKAENPHTYVRYAKQSGSWTLRPLSSGGGDDE